MLKGGRGLLPTRNFGVQKIEQKDTQASPLGIKILMWSLINVKFIGRIFQKRKTTLKFKIWQILVNVTMSILKHQNVLWECCMY